MQSGCGIEPVLDFEEMIKSVKSSRFGLHHICSHSSGESMSYGQAHFNGVRMYISPTEDTANHVANLEN